MARPRKVGLDYFPFDVYLDDQFKAIEELHGNDGFVWIVNFWRAAYKTEDGIVDLSGILGVIGAKTSRILPDKQGEIIRDCIILRLLYEVEPQKYTSHGIQKRISTVNEERKKDRNYAKNELSDRKPPDNTRETGERKGKKTKEKEIKVNKNILFDEFWKLYPRRTGKGAAEKVWSKIKAPSETFELIKNALSWQVMSEQWTRDNGQYIPHPATYLNQNRWLDEKMDPIDAEKIEKERRLKMLKDRGIEI